MFKTAAERRSNIASMPTTDNRNHIAADPELGTLVDRATQAHVALMRGDVARYRAWMPLGDDFTLMAPFGGKPSLGGVRSDEDWAAIGRFFSNGHDSTLELVQAHRTADMVVLAVIERTHVQVGATPAQDWALRVTLVFRRLDGQWLLVHRHADPLANGISVARAAELARGTTESAEQA